MVEDDGIEPRTFRGSHGLDRRRGRFDSFPSGILLAVLSTRIRIVKSRTASFVSTSGAQSAAKRLHG